MSRYVNFCIVRFGLFFLIILSFLDVFVRVLPGSAASAAMHGASAGKDNFITASPARDIGYTVAADAAGNVFIAGGSNTEWGAPVNKHSGGASDCLVAMLDDNGSLQWHTFLGGLRYDECRAIALDGKGGIYVAGESGSPGMASLRAFGGGSYDGFVAKLDNDGVVHWSTFLGGAQFDGGYALAVDTNGGVVVVGNSVDTWGAPIESHSGTNHDGFAAKLDENGKMRWNTFLGGNDYDGVYALALDEAGNAYVAGESLSEWGFPVNGYNRGYFGNYDAFVAKLNNKGLLQWNTFIGGRGSDYGRGIAVDMKGYIYVTGNSNAVWGDPVFRHNGDYDVFAAKLDGNGLLQWNTFLGGKGKDYGRAITVNWTGNIFLTGQSASSWKKPVNPFSGTSDAFAAKLDSSGDLQWNTFVGGAGTDFGRHITIDGIGNIYLTGKSSSSWGTPVNTFQGESNCFIAQLNNAGVVRWSTFLRGR